MKVGQKGEYLTVNYVNLFSPEYMPKLEIVTIIGDEKKYPPSLFPLAHKLSAYPPNQVLIDVQFPLKWDELSGPELIPFLGSLTVVCESYNPDDTRRVDYLQKFTQLKELYWVNFYPEPSTTPAHWLPPSVERLSCTPSFFLSVGGSSKWLESVRYLTLEFDTVCYFIADPTTTFQINGLTNLQELKVGESFIQMADCLEDFEDIEEDVAFEIFQNFVKSLIDRILQSNKNLTRLAISATQLVLSQLCLNNIKHISLMFETYVSEGSMPRGIIEKTISEAPLLESFSIDVNANCFHVLSYPFLEQLVRSKSSCLQTFVLRFKWLQSSNKRDLQKAMDRMWIGFNEPHFKLFQFCSLEGDFTVTPQICHAESHRPHDLIGMLIDLKKLRSLLQIV